MLRLVTDITKGEILIILGVERNVDKNNIEVHCREGWKVCSCKKE
jgi:hypothetical protein